jgi:hypothetical protein
MYKYDLQPQDGMQVIESKQGGELYHDIGVSVSGSAPAGSLKITAKKYGSDVFEDIPDGTIDLSAVNSIQFTGGVKQYQFDLSGVSGITILSVTDVAQKV